MPCPAYLWLQQYGLSAGDFCLIKALNIGNVVTPMNVDDCAETALMEALKES